jgi:hypothetical protein
VLKAELQDKAPEHPHQEEMQQVADHAALIPDESRCPPSLLLYRIRAFQQPVHTGGWRTVLSHFAK